MRSSISSLRNASFIVICAAVLALLCCPLVAHAGSTMSPIGANATDGEVTLNVKADAPAGSEGRLLCVRSDRAAKNVVVGENEKLMASFRVYTEPDSYADELEDIILTFYVGSEYAGQTATVYNEASDGSVDSAAQKIASDGTISISFDKMEYLSVVLDTTPGGGGDDEDHGGDSPQTGTDYTPYLVGGAVLVCAAAAIAFSTRSRRD